MVANGAISSLCYAADPGRSRNLLIIPNPVLAVCGEGSYALSGCSAPDGLLLGCAGGDGAREEPGFEEAVVCDVVE